jgi:universal stress protein A
MATDYNRILAAIDFSHENTAVIDRAVEIAQRYQAELTLLHIVEDLTLYQGEDPSIFDAISIQTERIERATQQMNIVRAQTAVPGMKTRIEVGTPKRKIVDIAEEDQVDLIVIGSHGRHGLQLLLGSTANGVLHSARCDVLAVRVND